MFNFEKLDVYKESLDFVNKIYNLINSIPKEEKFCLSEQLRRADISISTNIAEGSGRTKKEFVHFLNISRSTLYECVCLLQIALNLGYICKEDYDSLYKDAELLSTKVSALLNFVKQSIKQL